MRYWPIALLLEQMADPGEDSYRKKSLVLATPFRCKKHSFGSLKVVLNTLKSTSKGPAGACVVNLLWY